MEDFSFVPSAPVVHNVELYTSRFFVEGKLSGPFKRMSDILNRRDSSNILVEEASITPMGHGVEAKRTLASLVVVRSQIHFAANARQEQESITGPGTGDLLSGGLSASREYVIHKNSLPCYALTDTFAIQGLCYLHSGTTLQNLLDREEPFMPITDATIYPIAQPRVNWRRGLVVVNKARLELIYITEE